jgi:hypothetical protein
MQFTSLFHQLSFRQSALAIALFSSLTILGTPQSSQARSLDFEFLDCQEGDANLKIKMNQLRPGVNSIYMDGYTRGFGPRGFGLHGEFSDWVETPEYISLPVPADFGRNRPDPIAEIYEPRWGGNGSILDLRLYKQTGDRYKVIVVTSYGNENGLSSQTLNNCQVKNLSLIKKILPDRSKSALVCNITVASPPPFTVLNENWKRSNSATVEADRKCQ